SRTSRRSGMHRRRQQPMARCLWRWPRAVRRGRRAGAHGARGRSGIESRLNMHLVQIFLPLYDNAGKTFPKALHDAVRTELADRFGGVTAFLHSPAVGAWEDDQGAVQRDEVVLFEVMTGQIDHRW